MNCVIKAFMILLNKSETWLNEYFKDSTFYEEYWSTLLSDNGFKKIEVLPVPLKKRLTARELCETVSSDKLVLARCAHHVVAIKNNTIYDVEDAYNLCVYHYYIK